MTETEVRERLQKFGPNKLAEEERISKWKILLHQFTSPLIYILLIAAVVTAFLQEYKDTGVIVAIVLLNAVIGYIQEYKAEKNVRALKSMVVARARVLRDGKELEINGEDLVPGDIVFLASGSRVPADLRLIKTIELRADESMLTGESIPAEKMASSHPGGQSHPWRPEKYDLYGYRGGERPGQRGGGGHGGQDGPGPDRQGRPGTRGDEVPPPGKDRPVCQYHRHHCSGGFRLAFPHRHPGGDKRQRHVHDRGGGRGGRHPRGAAYRA